MSLTFVHTADWHLGHVYRRLGPRAAESAQWRLEAVRNIFDVATAEKAAFIVVAGDVFDTDTPSAHTMRHAVELLRDAPAPVYMISGNHDPCAEGSVWFHREFAEALQGVRNVRFAMEATPLSLPDWDTELFPCPVASRHTRDDTTSWIPAAARGGHVRIGLAHGGWRGYYHDAGGSPVKFNEIDSNCAERCGLDYLALGDYHSYTHAEHPAAKLRSYYAGTPECGAADDARAGHALVVRIEAPGADPVVEPRRVGRVEPHDWGRIVLRPGGGLDDLSSRLTAIDDRDHALVRASIGGCIAEAERKDLEQWLNELREAVLGADIDVSQLYTEPTGADFEDLALEPAERRILEMLNGNFSPVDLIGVRDSEYIRNWSDDELARREARNLFYQLLKETR
jgi:DNA repair exonuclease SbcCD nuclease subunit